MLTNDVAAIERKLLASRSGDKNEVDVRGSNRLDVVIAYFDCQFFSFEQPGDGLPERQLAVGKATCLHRLFDEVLDGEQFLGGGFSGARGLKATHDELLVGRGLEKESCSCVSTDSFGVRQKSKV